MCILGEIEYGPCCLAKVRELKKKQYSIVTVSGYRLRCQASKRLKAI